MATLRALLPTQAAHLAPITTVQNSLRFNFVPLLVARGWGYFRQEGITTSDATADLFMRYLLQTDNVNADQDMEIAPLGGVSTQVARLRGERVDGCFCLPPVAVLTDREGLTVNAIERPNDVPQLAGVTYGTLHRLASCNKAHPEIATVVTCAAIRGMLLIALDPEAAKRATRHAVLKQSERLMPRWREEGQHV